MGKYITLVGLVTVWFVSISFTSTQNQARCSVSLYARSHHSSLTRLVTTVPTLYFHADHTLLDNPDNTDVPTHDCLLIRIPPFSIPLFFLIVPPRTCSAADHGHGHIGFFRLTIRPKDRRHIEVSRPFLACWHLDFLATLFMVHPTFLRQSFHDTTLL